MAIPLPTAEQLFPAGGQITRHLEGLNALRKHFLENKYYSPNMESQIGHRNALTKGKNIENEYLPEQLRLANAFHQLQNENYAPNIQSEMANRNALTNKIKMMMPLEAEELRLKNQLYPEYTKSQIQNNLALARNRQMGGPSGMGVGAKEQLFFEGQVGKDNPWLKPEEYYEAANVLANGGEYLSDGRKLKPLSPAARTTLDRLVKGSTTAPVVTQSVQANQAHEELKVLEKLSLPDFKSYGTTFFGMSPEQVIDTFKKDDKSQTKLGKFIASQAAQFEIAQIRNRMANGQPSVSATEELMGKSGQIIDTKYPRLSAKAREVAATTLDEYLDKALEARNKAGMHPSLIEKGGNPKESNQPNAQVSRKESAFLQSVQPGFVLVEKNGNYVQIPKNNLEKAKAMQYKEVK